MSFLIVALRQCCEMLVGDMLYFVQNVKSPSRRPFKSFFIAGDMDVNMWTMAARQLLHGFLFFLACTSPTPGGRQNYSMIAFMKLSVLAPPCLNR